MKDVSGGGEATSPYTVGIVLPDSAQTRKSTLTVRVCSMFVSVHKKNKGGDLIDTQSFMYQLTINAPIEKGFTY